MGELNRLQGELYVEGNKYVQGKPYPQLTQIEIDTLIVPIDYIVFNTDTNNYQTWNGTIWVNKGIDIYTINDTLISTSITEPLSANQGRVLKNLINDLQGSLMPQGNWDADTNIPDISTETITGHYWIVSVEGTEDIGGITDWKINDWVIKTDTGWAKIDNTDLVSSVNGKLGDVVLNKTDIGLSNVDNTADVDKNVLSATKWTTPRSITIGGKTKLMDGTSDLTWSLSEMNLVSGSYIPVLESINGIQTNPYFYTAYYQKIGNLVRVTGRLSVNSSNTRGYLRFSLPPGISVYITTFDRIWGDFTTEGTDFVWGSFRSNPNYHTSVEMFLESLVISTQYELMYTFNYYV